MDFLATGESPDSANTRNADIVCLWSLVGFAKLRHLDKLKILQVRPRDIRRLGPIATENYSDAPLQVVASRIVITTDLLTGQAVDGKLALGDDQPALILPAKDMRSAKDIR